MIQIAAIFLVSTLIVYVVGVSIEVVVRKDTVEGIPKTIRQIIVGEILSSVILGAFSTAVICGVIWVMA